LVIVVLCVGSLIMLFSEIVHRNRPATEITPRRGFFIGLFQTLALLPGMSRSGATISGALFLGISREQATRFSFILAFPILLGSGLKKLFDLNSSGVLFEVGPELLLGSVVSFVVGLCAIHFLIKYLKNHSLKIFIYYRILLALIAILFLI